MSPQLSIHVCMDSLASQLVLIGSADALQTTSHYRSGWLIPLLAVAGVQHKTCHCCSQVLAGEAIGYRTYAQATQAMSLILSHACMCRVCSTGRCVMRSMEAHAMRTMEVALCHAASLLMHTQTTVTPS